jgi:hypothetical protein
MDYVLWFFPVDAYVAHRRSIAKVVSYVVSFSS